MGFVSEDIFAALPRLLWVVLTCTSLTCSSPLKVDPMVFYNIGIHYVGWASGFSGESGLTQYLCNLASQIPPNTLNHPSSLPPQEHLALLHPSKSLNLITSSQFSSQAQETHFCRMKTGYLPFSH